MNSKRINACSNIPVIKNKWNPINKNLRKTKQLLDYLGTLSSKNEIFSLEVIS